MKYLFSPLRGCGEVRNAKGSSARWEAWEVRKKWFFAGALIMRC